MYWGTRTDPSRGTFVRIISCFFPLGLSISSVGLPSIAACGGAIIILVELAPKLSLDFESGRVASYDAPRRG